MGAEDISKGTPEGIHDSFSGRVSQSAEPPSEESHKFPAEGFKSVGDPESLPSDAVMNAHENLVPTELSVPPKMIEGDRGADIVTSKRNAAQQATEMHKRKKELSEALDEWVPTGEFRGESPSNGNSGPSRIYLEGIPHPDSTAPSQISYLQVALPMIDLSEAPFEASKASDVLGFIIDTFGRTANVASIGSVTQVLCGTPMDDPEVLVQAVEQLLHTLSVQQFRHTVAETLRQRYSREGDKQLTNEKPDPSVMAVYWSLVRELDPPNGADVFPDFSAAKRAVLRVFPALAMEEGIDLGIDIAVILTGGIAGITPEMFEVMIKQARALQSGEDHAIATTLLDENQPKDLVTARTDDGSEILITNVEQATLNETVEALSANLLADNPLVDDGITLDQVGELDLILVPTFDPEIVEPDFTANAEWDVPLPEPETVDPIPAIALDPIPPRRSSRLPGISAPIHSARKAPLADKRPRVVPGWLVAILVGLFMAFLTVCAMFLLSKDAVQDLEIEAIDQRSRSNQELYVEFHNKWMVTETDNRVLTLQRDTALSERDQALMSADQWAQALDDANKGAKTLDTQLERRLKFELGRVDDKTNRVLAGQVRLMQLLEQGLSQPETAGAVQAAMDAVPYEFLTSVVRDNKCPSIGPERMSDRTSGRKFGCEIGGEDWFFICHGDTWMNANHCEGAP